MAEQKDGGQEGRDVSLPQEMRMQMAIRTYREAYAVYEVAIHNPNIGKAEAMSKKPSQRDIARRHGIDHSTLSRRLRGQNTREAASAMQRLKHKPNKEPIIKPIKASQPASTNAAIENDDRAFEKSKPSGGSNS